MMVTTRAVDTSGMERVFEVAASACPWMPGWTLGWTLGWRPGWTLGWRPGWTLGWRLGWTLGWCPCTVRFLCLGHTLGECWLCHCGARWDVTLWGLLQCTKNLVGSRPLRLVCRYRLVVCCLNLCLSLVGIAEAPTLQSLCLFLIFLLFIFFDLLGLLGLLSSLLGLLDSFRGVLAFALGCFVR